MPSKDLTNGRNSTSIATYRKSRCTASSTRYFCQREYYGDFLAWWRKHARFLNLCIATQPYDKNYEPSTQVGNVDTKQQPGWGTDFINKLTDDV